MLLHHVEVDYIFQALSPERQIKCWGRKKWALIRGDMDRLKMLAACQNDTTSVFASSEYVRKHCR